MINEMIKDKSVSWIKRRADTNWWFNRSIGLFDSTVPLLGFCPFSYSITTPSEGIISKWLEDPDMPIRSINRNDCAIKYILFMCHDYIHAWATSWLANNALNQLACCESKTDQDLEIAAFLHILTEACATIGLDYWYLSTLQLNSVVDIGSNQKTLTTSYHENEINEYRRYERDLIVQSPVFFERLSIFYCTGEWVGLSLKDLNDSPILASWIEHELRYGKKQRKYIREYLSYANGIEVTHSLDSPIPCHHNWQRDLINNMAYALWDFVKNGNNQSRPLDIPFWKWKKPPLENFDPRYSNLSSLDEDEEFTVLSSLINGSEKAKYCALQFISSFYDCELSRKDLVDVRSAMESANLMELYEKTRDWPRIDKGSEPFFMMFRA
ncbi:hypothetical protein [Chromobacterium violaceum]|uniref:hypothetical protein n=1 Tax=Chromobacterium violaceum TaxID=536 RepID=UPI0012D3038A|nr:hypothetical protein [Chromobacterium violaceum]